MAHTLLAPVGTTCGNGYCKSNVCHDDTEIVRYMGRIFHKRCFNAQIMFRARQAAYQEFLVDVGEAKAPDFPTLELVAAIPCGIRDMTR